MGCQIALSSLRLRESGHSLIDGKSVNSQIHLQLYGWHHHCSWIIAVPSMKWKWSDCCRSKYWISVSWFWWDTPIVWFSVSWEEGSWRSWWWDLQFWWFPYRWSPSESIWSRTKSSKALHPWCRCCRMPDSSPMTWCSPLQCLYHSRSWHLL